MDKVISGKIIQNKVKKELVFRLSSISEKLKIVVIQIGDNPESNVYIRNKKNICEELGIIFECKKFDSITQDDLLSLIDELNNDNSVTGIFLQFPIPDYFDENLIVDRISSLKDIDGLTSVNLGKLYSGDRAIVPCTALSVMKIVDEVCDELEGKTVVILGKSKLVGLPLIKLFLDRGATVISCNSKTKNLKEKTLMADILVVAIGNKEFIDDSYVKDGVIVIDVGINKFEGKLYGDCNFDKIYDKCHCITPVPGGVGLLTVVMLVNNLILAYELQKNNK